MANADHEDEVDEEALVMELADLLSQRGFHAEAWQSGGDTYVVAIKRSSGNVQYWGLAAGTWGGYEADKDEEELPGSSVVTEIEPANTKSAAEFIASRL